MFSDVSIIIPVYNGETFLRECLESVLSQTGVSLEVICVNDGSTDGSLAILEEYASRDGRIQVIDRENCGVSAARNCALELADGKYVLFLDCDDFYPDAETVSALFAAAEKSGSVITGGSFTEIYPDGGIVETFTGKKSRYTFSGEGWIKFSEYACIYGFQRYLFRLDFLREHQLKFPPYIMFEDPVFLARAMVTAERFYAIPRPVYRYRQRATAPKFTGRKIRDAVSGGCDILEIIAGKPAYGELRREIVEDFLGDFSEGDKTAMGNLCLQQLSCGDTELALRLLKTSAEANQGRLLPPLAKIMGRDTICETDENWIRSFRWRQCCRFFRIRQKVHGFLRCLIENGIIYTIRRMFHG